MYGFILNMNLIASHTMPDLIPDVVEYSLLFTIIPITVASLWGAKVGATPFRRRRVVGVVLGIILGMATVIPALILSLFVVITLYRQLGASGDALGFAMIIAMVYFLSSGVAFSVALVGRIPGPPQLLTMETLNQNMAEIERIMSSRLEQLGVESNSREDPHIAQYAGVISTDQASCFVEIRDVQKQMKRAHSVLHSDVHDWAMKSSELLESIKLTASTGLEMRGQSGVVDPQDSEDRNPYRPPTTPVDLG